MDKKLYLSVENEGLRQCINTLRTALKVMRRNFDTANRKLRSLTREHSKCPDKRKIMFLYRWLSFIISGFCCEGHINATSFERQECLRHLDEFIDYVISNFHEIWNILRWSHFLLQLFNFSPFVETKSWERKEEEWTIAFCFEGFQKWFESLSFIRQTSA
jgi:hypothetical protein